MRKICVIASSRATYGYKRKILKLLSKDKSFNLSVVVTGMHLEKKYGYSIRDIIKDKIPITKKIPMNIKDSSNLNFLLSLSTELKEMSKILSKLKPDILLITGDRSEMFIACISAVFLNIPVAHIQAGDVSGHIDGNVRHAITKLSHIHFASCLDSKQRVLKLGEEKKRVYNVGAPQLDELIKIKKDKFFLKKFLKQEIKSPVILIIQHPILIDSKSAGSEILETLNATNEINAIKIVIYPNFDTGSSEIISKILKFQNNDNFYFYKNLNREIFLNILVNSDLLIGNSSCGILEAPSFKIPVINIGNRQRGRMQASNILNVSANKNAILKKIKFVFSNRNYRKNLKNCINPYGDGKSSERIIKIIKKIQLGKNLLDKKITY